MKNSQLVAQATSQGIVLFFEDGGQYKRTNFNTSVLENERSNKVNKDILDQYTRNWKHSETRRQQIKAIQTSKAGCPLTTMHKDRYTTLRPSPQKAREAVESLFAIDKLTNVIFAR